jgi:hypothetical protein
VSVPTPPATPPAGTRRGRQARRGPTSHHRSHTPTAGSSRYAATGTGPRRPRPPGDVRSPHR